MKVVLWFLAGIAVGMWGVILVTDGKLSKYVPVLRTLEIHRDFFDKKAAYIPTPENVTNKLSVSPSPSPIPSNTPTPKPVVHETPTPSLTPTPAVPQFTSEQLNGFIEKYSGQYGVDPNVMRAIAICESGFDAAKKSGNGKYWGLYQFSVSSWRSNRVALGMNADPVNRLNGEEAVRTAAYILSKGKGFVWPNCMP